jgi:glycosyltransferase involved in cell wall biosynthesis
VRILLVSSGSGSRGGGEIFLNYLGKGLADRGHEVVMWIPKHARMDELAEKCSQFARILRTNYDNTYDYRARSLSTCLNWGTSRRIADEWKALRPDIVHINKQNLEDGLDLLRAAQQCALPTVCTIHLTQTAHYLRAKAAWLRDMIARSQLRRYTGVIVTVQERRREILSDFLSECVRTTTIFNGVPRVEPVALRSLRKAKRQELGLTDDAVLVLGIGRLVAQKQPMRFLSIAKELHVRVPSTSFLWVGDGKLGNQWQEAIIRHQLEGFVSSVGWQGDVLPYFAAGDLLLHVAQFEGLPFVVLEAMAAGLACAVTRELSAEIPLFTETNVLFVDDIRNLAETLKNRPCLIRIADAGRDLVESELSLEKMIRSYEQLYLDEIEAKQNPSLLSDAFV